jgi:RND family efflux transporter MFP subunit
LIAEEDDLTLVPGRALCLAALLTATIVCVGCTTRTIAAAPQEMPVVPASRAVRMDLKNDVTLTAELEPYYEVDVMAKEAGYIRHMLVDIGDHVKVGQLLCVLEIPELQDDLQRAKADVETANAEQAAAEQDRKRAVAAAAIAQLSYTRILDVSKKEPGLVPLQEVDVAHSRDLEAEAQVASAEQNVQASLSRLQGAKAELEHETALVEYTRIVSPLNGVITQRYASDGAMIQAGTSSSTQAMPVVHVAEDDTLRLMLPVPEAYVGTIHDSEPVTVTVPSLGRTFPGKVTRFSDHVQTSTRTMTTEVDVKNPKLQLIPGMYAEVDLNLTSARDAVAVPIEALDNNGSDHTAFVVNGAGVIHIRQVKTGLQSPQYVQILSGVQAGEIVIVGRHSDYHDGERVQPDLQDTNTGASHS